jgi:hypothetical protein
MESIDRIDLAERARGRAASIFRAWDLLNIASPLGNLEAVLNQTHRHKAEQLLVVTDRIADIHEDQHHRETTQSLGEIDQEALISQERYDTGIQRNAIRLAAEEVSLAVKMYDVAVKDAIMVAREFAALIERELIALEAQRAEMDVRKQTTKLLVIQAKIQEEAVKKAQVQAEIARAWLEVAKDHVKVLMAEYEADAAELKVVQTELEVVQAQVEQTTLRADIAMIFADIVTRKLSQTKYDVENKALLQQFQFVGWKLGSMLSRWDTEVTASGVRKSAEEQIYDLFLGLIEADRQEHLLSLYQIVKGTELLVYERGKTMTSSELASLSNTTWREAHAELLEMKYSTWKALLQADTWSKSLVNEAKRWAYLHLATDAVKMTDEHQLINKG